MMLQIYLTEPACVRAWGYFWTTVIMKSYDVFDDRDYQAYYYERGGLPEFFEYFERGVQDAHYTPPAFKTAAEFAAMNGVGVRYIRDEIRRGNLPSIRLSNAATAPHYIDLNDENVSEWISNPRRGSRAPRD